MQSLEPKKNNKKIQLTFVATDSLLRLSCQDYTAYVFF